MKALRLIVCLLSSLSVLSAQAYDDDDSINQPDFRAENFLDIKAYEFRKRVEEEWHAASSGWRMAGGSLATDLSYIDSEIRLSRDLSETFSIRLRHDHQAYYVKKPTQHPLLELAVRPWRSEFEFSLLGTAAYDKRQSDLGFAVSYGDQQKDFLRVHWLSVDHYYDSKNYLDDGYYQRQPETVGVQAARRLGQWQLRLSAQSDADLKRVTPAKSETFQHQGDSLELMLDYHYAKNSLLGFSYRSWQMDKALTTSSTNHSQAMSHYVFDLYWLRPYRWLEELTLGMRLDQFTNELRDLNNSTQDYNYSFDTVQLYAMAQHTYSQHAAWGVGIYLGSVKENKDYLLDTGDGNAGSDSQGKLRTSWEYFSQDKRDRFSVHLTFNLDDLRDDPGDGAGLSYQGLF